jgi:acetyltransferase-like isoleucine patch superfamily enzyme
VAKVGMTGGRLAGWVPRLLRELRAAAGRRRVLDALAARSEGLHLGAGVEIRSPDRLHLGARVTLDSGVLLHCGGMDWTEGRGEITIGDDTYVGPQCVLFGAGGIRIGRGVLISPGVVITSHQHTFTNPQLAIRAQPMSFAPIVIEDDVWIGSNATVLPGVHIGAGSVIGAGAVVTTSLPAGVVALGVPARIRRPR